MDHTVRRYEALVRHRELSYAECHRVCLYLCACVASGRSEAATAALTLLRDHTRAQREIGYLSGVLLCVTAVLTMNSAVRALFGLGLSLLRATLDRAPGSSAVEISRMRSVPTSCLLTH